MDELVDILREINGTILTSEEIERRFKTSFPIETIGCRSIIGCLKKISNVYLENIIRVKTPLECKQIFEDIYYVINTFGVRDSSIRVYCTYFHNIIKRTLSESKISQCNNIINLPIERRERLDELLIEKRNDKLNDVLIYSKDDVNRLMVQFRNSTQVHEIAIYLLLVTGRRFIELSTSNFNVEESCDKCLCFNLQAKCKTEEEKNRVRTFPLLDDKKHIQSKIEDFRWLASDTKLLSNPEITNRYNKKIGKILTRFFGQPTSGHTLRKIYVQLCLDKFNKNSKIADYTYICNILSHSENSEATLNYLNLKLV